MNTMPVKIKNKLRQLRKVHEKASVLADEVEEMFKEYGIDTEYLRGLVSYGYFRTEELTFI